MSKLETAGGHRRHRPPLQWYRGIYEQTELGQGYGSCRCIVTFGLSDMRMDPDGST